MGGPDDRPAACRRGPCRAASRSGGRALAHGAAFSKAANVLVLFPPEGEWARTRVLEARTVETCEFEAFARYRTIRETSTYARSGRLAPTGMDPRQGVDPHAGSGSGCDVAGGSG